MSIRLESLQVARQSKRLLLDSVELIQGFLDSQEAPMGGFQDRGGRVDLYYTVFGLECSVALDRVLDIEKHFDYLKQVQNLNVMDLVHLCSLIRCQNILITLEQRKMDTAFVDQALLALRRFQCHPFGAHPQPGSNHGTAYAAFMVTAALQDLGVTEFLDWGFMQSLAPLEKSSGGWSNEIELPLSATNSTAAAMTVARQCHSSMDPIHRTWLLQQFHPQGGFRAAPQAPIPDLLSTATALHALAEGSSYLNKTQTELCLDFVDSLWTNKGAFHGHWYDDFVDTEYTFYGLLALGHLGLNA